MATDLKTPAQRRHNATLVDRRFTAATPTVAASGDLLLINASGDVLLINSSGDALRIN